MRLYAPVSSKPGGGQVPGSLRLDQLRRPDGKEYARTHPRRTDAERWLDDVKSSISKGQERSGVRKSVFALRAMLDAAVANQRLAVNVPLPLERAAPSRGGVSSVAPTGFEPALPP